MANASPIRLVSNPSVHLSSLVDESIVLVRFVGEAAQSVVVTTCAGNHARILCPPKTYVRIEKATYSHASKGECGKAEKECDNFKEVALQVIEQ